MCHTKHIKLETKFSRGVMLLKTKIELLYSKFEYRGKWAFKQLWELKIFINIIVDPIKMVSLHLTVVSMTTQYNDIVLDSPYTPVVHVTREH